VTTYLRRSPSQARRARQRARSAVLLSGFDGAWTRARPTRRRSGPRCDTNRNNLPAISGATERCTFDRSRRRQHPSFSVKASTRQGQSRWRRRPPRCSRSRARADGSHADGSSVQLVSNTNEVRGRRPRPCPEQRRLRILARGAANEPGFTPRSTRGQRPKGRGAGDGGARHREQGCSGAVVRVEPRACTSRQARSTARPRPVRPSTAPTSESRLDGELSFFVDYARRSQRDRQRRHRTTTALTWRRCSHLRERAAVEIGFTVRRGGRAGLHELARKERRIYAKASWMATPVPCSRDRLDNERIRLLSRIRARRR